MADFLIGQRVRALVHMENDLRDDGMGIEHCASKGDVLVVRRISGGIVNSVIVSHEHITDRSFCAAPGELELIPEDPKEPTHGN